MWQHSDTTSDMHLPWCLTQTNTSASPHSIIQQLVLGQLDKPSAPPKLSMPVCRDHCHSAVMVALYSNKYLYSTDYLSYNSSSSDITKHASPARCCPMFRDPSQNVSCWSVVSEWVRICCGVKGALRYTTLLASEGCQPGKLSRITLLMKHTSMSLHNSTWQRTPTNIPPSPAMILSLLLGMQVLWKIGKIKLFVCLFCRCLHTIFPLHSNWHKIALFGVKKIWPKLIICHFKAYRGFAFGWCWGDLVLVKTSRELADMNPATPWNWQTWTFRFKCDQPSNIWRHITQAFLLLTLKPGFGRLWNFLESTWISVHSYPALVNPWKMVIAIESPWIPL